MTRAIMFHDRVLVRPVQQPDRTPSGLTIPESARERRHEGIVVEAGPGKETGKLNAHGEAERIPLSVNAGDRVFFSKYAPDRELTVNGETLLVMREEEIHGVLIEEQ
jgi:chaperonin GroES